jgi:hypothetical protein
MKREKMISVEASVVPGAMDGCSDKNFCSIVFSQERKDISPYFDGKNG